MMWSAVRLLMLRNLKVAVRNGPTLAFTLLQPVIWMALFSQNFRRLTEYPEFSQLGYTSYLSFFVPSIMVLSILNSATLSGMSTVTDMTAGVLAKFVLSPIGRVSILLGRVFADAVSMAVQCLVVLVIAFIMGAEAETGPLGVLAVLALTVALGMCAAAFSNLIALRTGNAQLTMLVGAVSAVPLLLLSPAFFPKPLQAQWLQDVQMFNPVSYVVTAGQDLLNLGVDGGQLAATAAVLALAGGAFGVGAVRAFRRATSGPDKPPAVFRILGVIKRMHGIEPGVR